MAAARFGAKLKSIRPNQKYHACISYHTNVEETVEKSIVKRLEKLDFKITKVSCENKTNFSNSLESSDAWVEVVTDEYEKCEHCESRYQMFTKVREGTKTKLLQKWIHIPQDEIKDKTVLHVHSDYSADVDAFSGQENGWLGDLQLAIVTRFHAFLSYHESDKEMAEKIMNWLKEKCYLFTHKGKFLSLNDTKKAAVEKKMSEKIIVLFSDSYMKNRSDLDLVLPVLQDRGPAAWLPVVLEFSNDVNHFLDYLPRLVLLSKDIIDDQNKTGTWEKEMEKLQNGIHKADGLPSDCGTTGRDGPPEKLPFQSVNNLVRSVGKIHIHEKNKMTGTGFCVGKKEDKEHRYVFTAYHVFARAIDDMIKLLVDQCSKEQKESLLLKICFREEKFKDHWQTYCFRQTKDGGVNFGGLFEIQDGHTFHTSLLVSLLPLNSKLLRMLRKGSQQSVVIFRPRKNFDMAAIVAIL
ncbi:uncharacterized protein LOC117321603 isoform X2 [Pecten maximus]|uniref:uncharacterized protein LOC117321603 isoform X2 n=1 Tax=Pecten maximus TaxID=6579 RepID=UPI0014584A16|nr:uncharacterized protein LOC117321603 isoform X2 [Pecten maximus]